MPGKICTDVSIAMASCMLSHMKTGDELVFMKCFSSPTDLQNASN